MKTQTLDLNKMGLACMNLNENTNIFGGDVGYYGNGPDLSLAVNRISNAAHQVGDFFRGLWNGLAN